MGLLAALFLRTGCSCQPRGGKEWSNLNPPKGKYQEPNLSQDHGQPMSTVNWKTFILEYFCHQSNVQKLLSQNILIINNQ